MQKAKYYVIFLVGCLFSASSYAETTNHHLLTFPEASDSSIWQQPHHRYDEGSKPYELNSLYKTFGQNEADIINVLGEPLKRTEKQVPNRHQPKHKMTVSQLFYDGLTIELLTTDEQRSSVKRVFISNCDIPSDFQLYLCTTAESLKGRLGQPSVETNSELTYLITIGDIGAVPLRIFLKNGNVTGIYAKNLID